MNEAFDGASTTDLGLTTMRRGQNHIPATSGLKAHSGNLNGMLHVYMNMRATCGSGAGHAGCEQIFRYSQATGNRVSSYIFH